jgi:hypothetical protein
MCAIGRGEVIVRRMGLLDFLFFFIMKLFKGMLILEYERTGISRLLSAISLKKGGLFEKTLPFCFTYCFFYFHLLDIK